MQGIKLGKTNFSRSKLDCRSLQRNTIGVTNMMCSQPLQAAMPMAGFNHLIRKKSRTFPGSPGPVQSQQMSKIWRKNGIYLQYL